MTSTRLVDLLERVPASDRGAVEVAKSRFAGAAREHVRELMRLSLAPRRGAARDGPRAEIRVAVKDGYPTGLEEIVVEEDLDVLSLLLQHHRALVDVAGGGRGLAELVTGLRELQLGSSLLRGRDASVAPVRSLVDDLLRRIQSVDVARRLLWVDSDVLGAYSYPRSAQAGLFGDGGAMIRTSIELYWAPISLVAKALAVSIEAVTAVVLLHEFGHAFSHVGLDSEDRRWATASFAMAGHALVEGIAQYCAHILGKELEREIPDIVRAYTEMVQRQPDAYRTHLRWVEPPAEEAFRRALLGVRCQGRATLQHFEEQREAAIKDAS